MNILNLLSSQTLTKWLCGFNLLIGVLTLFLFKNQTGGDTQTYLGLADGIINGQYSYWHFTNYYFPDTFRNPGYPMFLVLFRMFTDSILVVQLFQLAIYFLSIFLMLQIIAKLFNSVEIKNLFLLLLIPSIYVASYSAMIFPEILVTFLILLFIRIDVEEQWNTITKYLLLGLLFGLIFQIRPVIIFIPFIYVFVKRFIYRNGFSWFKHLAMITVFLITMIPYGLWNHKNHGVFKITSLEGGGGVFHLGYWAMKLPDFYEGRYWNNYCVREMIPMIDESERQANIDRYNREWDQIDSIVNPLLTAKDTLMISLHNENTSLFKTNSSPYVIKREEVLKDMAIKNILSDLPWYIKVKSYSAVRLWVTGIPLKKMKSAGWAEKALLSYPFFITLVTFISALLLVPMLFYRKPEIRKKLLVILLVTLYFGIIHLPFTIQSRYTVPVRMELLLMISVAIYYLFLMVPKKSRE